MHGCAIGIEAEIRLAGGDLDAACSPIVRWRRKQIDSAGQVFYAAGRQRGESRVEAVDGLCPDNPKNRMHGDQPGFKIASTTYAQDVRPLELKDEAMPIIKNG